jgi:hypothetical protein
MFPHNVDSNDVYVYVYESGKNILKLNPNDNGYFKIYFNENEAKAINKIAVGNNMCVSDYDGSFIYLQEWPKNEETNQVLQTNIIEKNLIFYKP